MYLIYSAELSLFCSVIPKQTDASLPYWHWFKNSIMQKSGPLIHNLHKEPCHFPIILKSVTCHLLLQWSELHYRFLCLSSEMMYMPHHLSTAYFRHDRIFNLLTIWENASMLMGDMKKNMILRWKN